jgi:GDSL-like Lipase/Acylhydrolase family/Putative peptidoglycan binding domain
VNRAARFVVVACVAAVLTWSTTSEGRQVEGASFPDGLVWLALGDSYSSGEGLQYVDQDANPVNSTCERATGRTSVNNGQGSRAWAAVAYDEVRGELANSTFRLLACTGARTDQIKSQYFDEWLASSQPRADLVTLSMGGNNLGFADVIHGCVGISVSGGATAAAGGALAWSLNPALGCTVSEQELRIRIDQLVGDSGGQTLRNMYREVAKNAVNRGGHVIVAGYPNVVEESGRWTLGWVEGNRCSRIRRSDTSMLRSVTGYLNEQIANLVNDVDREFDDVSFHWVDVSQIYESDAGRHGLCTGEPWINGITVGARGPDSGNVPFRITRSFHPTQDGHDATGAEVARLVRNLDWSSLERLQPAPETGAGVATDIAADGTGSISYLHPQLGAVTITLTNDPGNGAYRVDPMIRVLQDSTGEQVFEWSASEQYESFGFVGASSDDQVASPVDSRGHVFFKWNPGRFEGVSVLVPTETGFDSIGTLTADFYDAYYYAYVVDVDDDGAFELDQNFQICQPSCAAGVYYSQTWAWDGTTYTGSSIRSSSMTAEGVEVAGCVSEGNMFVGMDGPDPEVARLQERLEEFGYDPGDVDGYFGESTWVAAAESQVEFSDGSAGGNGVFADEQALLEPYFERLGISC